MTEAEAWKHADNQCVHGRKLKDAIETKGKDARRAVDNGLSESSATEIQGKHDAIISALSTAYHKTDNPHGYKSEQDAIDSLVGSDE